VPAAVARRPVRLNPVLTVAALLAVALVTWVVTIERMRGMDEGPGTDLGDLGWLIGVWVTMTAAMMSPLHFVMHRWREGAAGAFAMGLEHGAWCLGCCLGLMLVLFAVGVMSLAWMAVVALVIFAEKVLPGGARLTAPVAVCLVALGALIAVAPGRVPGSPSRA
jgi:predicted metal-binding membrane protein